MMVLLFTLSVAAIVTTITFFVATLCVITADPGQDSYAKLDGGVYGATALLTFLIIVVVSLVNVIKLAGGGAKVAQMLGGRLVAPGTQDRLERRLLNIVEEMSIASGVRLPQVYVMDN